MGRGGGVQARAPSQAAYYVALGGVALLLLMLCCYFLYFCISKIHELSEHESLCGAPHARAAPPAPARVSYPVQPVVRDSATAMAKLCQELPRMEAAPAALTPAGDAGGAGGAGGAGRAGARGGSVASAATLSEDTATTGTGDSAVS